MRTKILLVSAVAALLAFALTGASATTASEGVERSKLSPAMQQLVAQGGYGGFPMAEFVDGYRENFYVDDVSVVDAAGTPLAVGATNPDDMETTGTWVSGGSPGFSWVTADTAG